MDLSHVTAVAAIVKDLGVRVAQLWSKKRRLEGERRDSALAAGRRLVELMAAQASLMTLMLAKHHPFASARRIEVEAREFGRLAAQIEGCITDARAASALKASVDRLLDPALEAAEFAKRVKAWRRVDMATWNVICQRWANERAGFLTHLGDLAGGRPRDVL